MRPTKPRAALLSSPGMGHLIPMLELGKRLLTHHGFNVTIFVVTTDSSTTRSQILHQSPSLSSLNIVILPPVDVSDKLGPKPALGDRIALTMAESLPLLRPSILSMKPLPTALIVDMFGTGALAIARDLEMLTFVFFTSTAWLLALTVYVPVVDKVTLDRHLNNHKPLLIPGCKPVRFEDTLEPLFLRGKPAYDSFVQMGLDTSTADGVLVNTWQDLEPTTLQALRDSDVLGRIVKGTVYPVGPLVRTIVPEPNRKDEVFDWLDRQAAESVIFASFGSGGTFTTAQITELAWGLELSQQRFVWVVRPPKEDAPASGTFFKVADGVDGTADYLPEGFVKRTQKVGLVVPMWAPQAEILGHRSVGGFVTHSGWNSTLESIMNGVPMVAWPLYAEQMMNATMLTEELGVAARAKAREEVVNREEIGKLVKRIMVGEESEAMRVRVKELKRSAEKALCEGGSSFNSLCELRRHFDIHLKGKEPRAACDE